MDDPANAPPTVQPAPPDPAVAHIIAQNQHTQSSLSQLTTMLQPLLAWFAAAQAQAPPAIPAHPAPAHPPLGTAAPAGLALPAELRLPRLDAIDGRNPKTLRSWFDQVQGLVLAAGGDRLLASPHVVQFVAGHFRGPIRDWWSAKQEQTQDYVTAGYTSFIDLRDAVLSNHRIKDDAEDARNKLDHLRQTGNIEDYCLRTLELNRYLPNRNEVDRIHLFTKGLKTFEREYVVRGKPTTLDAAVRLATEGSTLYGRVHTSASPAPRKRAVSDPGAGPTPMDISNLTLTRDAVLQALLGTSKPTYKTVAGRVRTNTTKEEREELKRKGLCFKCKKHGHIAKDCPEPDPPKDKDKRSN